MCWSDLSQTPQQDPSFCLSHTSGHRPSTTVHSLPPRPRGLWRWQEAHTQTLLTCSEREIGDLGETPGGRKGNSDEVLVANWQEAGVQSSSHLAHSHSLEPLLSPSRHSWYFYHSFYHPCSVLAWGPGLLLSPKDAEVSVPNIHVLVCFSVAVI